jgi:uncharacterized protein (TIGR02186 family)
MRRALILLLIAMALTPATAQDKRPGKEPQRPIAPPASTLAPPVEVPTVEADVSTRSLEVTTGFTGHEIIVFGAIDNSQSPQDYAGYYDVVVVVEGTPFPLVVRKKSDVAGVWMNTSAITFSSVPSYYAIASTKPIEEIAGPAVLERHAIGFQHIKMTPSPGSRRTFKDHELAAFRAAVVRLKKELNLYVIEPNGVTFTGRSLFRSTIALPANVPVGPLVARTYLFLNGEVISAHIARVTLQRAGVERVVHNFAFIYPMSYGLIAVLIAVISGLLASAYFRRQPG